MRLSKNNKEIMSFKKRYNMGFKKPSILWGDFSMIFEKSYNVEYIYIKNFKKILKKFFKFKKKTKKVWFFLSKNYPLTKKSKNSRMGKGKGKFVRYCSRILAHHSIFEFSGFSILNLNRLKIIFNRKLKIQINIFSKFFKNKQYKFLKKNENFFFHKIRKK